MKPLITDQSIERYLSAVEAGIAISDGQAHKRLENQATELRDLVQETSTQLDEEDRKEARLLRLAIDELKLQYALGTMESREKLDEFEERIEGGIQKLKAAVGKVKTLSAKEKDDISEKLHRGWKRLKFQITMLYVRLETAYEVGSNNLTKGRAAVIKDVQTIRNTVKENAGQATHKSAAFIKSIEKKISKRSRRILDAMDSYFEDM